MKKITLHGRETFNALLQFFTVEIKEHFENFHSVAINFLVLDPEHFIDSNFQEQITKPAFFYKDITNDIFDELKCFLEVYGNIDLKRMTERLHFDAHDALFLFKNFFTFPKLTFFLRSAPCFNSKIL